jgi:PST family polysaccharide transporter
MLGGFLAGKMIAAFLGPAGMAITGSFRNFLTSVDTYSTLGLQNGIIKYTAEFQDEKDTLKRVLSTVFITIAIGIVVCGLGIALPATQWSNWVFNGNTQYAWVFRALGATLPLYTGSLVLTAMLNGLGKYNKVIYINIFGNLLGVSMSAVFIWYLQTDGALWGLVLSPAIVFLLSVYPLYKTIGGFKNIATKHFDKSLLKGLSSYSFMSLVTALLGTIIYITLRNHIINRAGMDEAGYLEGINRISSFYIMFATTLQTIYFLPMLARAKNDTEIRTTWHSYYKVVVPVFVAGLLLVYLLRKLVIKITLSDAFLPMEGLFIWQLTGDLFKVCSQILAQEFFARRMVKQFVVFEVGSFAIMYASGYYLINIYGVEGAVMAHAVTYLAYFAGMAFYFRKKLF